MADDNKLILEVGLDHSAVQRGLQVVRRAGQKFWQDVGKQANKYGKIVRDLAKPKLFNQMVNNVKKVASEYRRFDQAMGRYNAHINRLYKEMEDASDKRRKDIKREIAEMRRLQQVSMKREGKTLGGRARVLAYKGKEAVKGAAKDASGKDVAKAAGATILGAFAAGSALLKRDFEGVIENGVDAIGKGWKAAFSGAGKTFSMFGKGASALGKSLQKKGDKTGGIGGAALQGLGGVAKMLGGLGKTVGPVLNVVSKMGPLLSMAATSIMAIVKLLIDAEAAAKEINKQVLSVTGSAEMWFKYAGRTDVALEDMSQTLRSIRDDATSLQNLEWGITKDEHTAVLSTLAAEGVQVMELGKQFEDTGARAETAAAHAKSFGGAVQVAVAYSRLMGVSLQEITQFQSEMMTEMGSSLADVQAQFYQMTRAAADSGIASNKFFAIIRGVSADLNLYNSRLEDSVKILGMLGKVMSPRNAAKFMQTATQALKGMGRTERLKLNLLSGGKAGGMMSKQLDRYSGDIAGKINRAGGSVTAKDILDSNKDSAELLKGVPAAMQGEFREAILELRQDQTMNKKGVFGQSMAARNLGPGAALDMMKSALMRFAPGAKTLGEARGSIGPEMMAEQLGISEEQLSSMVKFEAAIDDQRKILKRTAKTDDERKKIDQMSYDDVMSTMDKSMQDELKNAGQQIDYAKRTSEYTFGAMDKLGVLVDFIMNQIYNVMTSIWEVIMDIASSSIFDPSGAKKDAREKAKIELEAAKTKNKELIDIAQKSTNGEAFKKNAMGSGLGKSMVDAITYDPSKLKTDKERDAAAEKFNAAAHAIDDQLGGTERDSTLKMQRVQQAAFGAFGNKYDSKQIGAINRSLEKGENISGALAGSGMSEADQQKMLAELMKTLSPQQLAKSMGDYAKATGATGTVPGAAGPGVPAVPGKPGASAAGAPTMPGVSAPAAVAAAAKAEPPMTTKQGAEAVDALDQVHKDMRVKGIKMDQSFLRDKFWANGKDAVLEATREALLEYFLYSKMDPATVAKGLKDGKFKAKDFGSKFLDAATTTGQIPTDIQGFAGGGVIPQPKSPDSVFVAARPGETIVPRGGAGGGHANLSIPINVNGPGGQELANMIRTAAINVVSEWQRRQKFA